MKKIKRLLVLILLMVLILPISTTNAESEASFGVGTVASGINSAIGTRAVYCYTLGCRTDYIGVKVSLKAKDGNTVLSYTPKTFTKDDSNNVTLYGITSNIKNGFEDLSSKILSAGGNNVFQGQTLEDLCEDYQETLFYKIVTDFDSGRYKLSKICDKGKHIQSEETKVNGTYKYKDYRNLIINTYVEIEPIIALTPSDEKNLKASSAFKEFGVDKLPDEFMKNIKSAVNNFSSLYNGFDYTSFCKNYANSGTEMLKVWRDTGGCPKDSSDGTCKSVMADGCTDDRKTNDLKRYLNALKTVADNYHTYYATEKTVREWAKWAMDGNYKYIDSDSDGNPLKSYDGSVSHYTDEFSYFMHLDKDIRTEYKAVSSKTSSWKTIKNSTGYGLNVLYATLDIALAPKCGWENNATVLPEGITDETECCGTGTFDPELWDSESKYKSFLKNRYEQICVCNKDDFNKYVDIESDTPTVTKIEPKVVQGKTLDCCYLENYSKDTQKSISKIKKPGWRDTEDGKLIIKTPKSGICGANYCTYDLLEKGQTEIVDMYGKKLDCCEYGENYGSNEDEIIKNSKHKDKITFEKSEAYIAACALECKWNGDRTEQKQTFVIKGKTIVLDCCKYENFGKEFKEKNSKITFESSKFYKEKCDYCTTQKLEAGDTTCCKDATKYSDDFQEGYRASGKTLKEYLIQLGVQEATYNRICEPNACSYAIDRNCSNCDDESTNNSRVLDTVKGVDSTELIFSDPDIEPCIFKNSNYKAVGNAYCEIYCTEKVEYNFPKKSTLNVTAGTRLVIGGNVSPLETKVTKTCRINKLDVEKFKRNITAARQKVVNAYRFYSTTIYPESDKIVKVENDQAKPCDCKYNTTNFSCCEEESTKVTSRSSKTGTLITYELEPTGEYGDCVQASMYNVITGEDKFVDGCKDYGDDCDYVNSGGSYNEKTGLSVSMITWHCEKMRKKEISDPYCEDSSYTKIGSTCIKYYCPTGKSDTIEYEDATRIGVRIVDEGKKTEYKVYKYKCAAYEDQEASEFETTDPNGGKNACTKKRCEEAICKTHNNQRYDSWSVKYYEYYQVINTDANVGRKETRYEPKVCETATNSDPLRDVYNSRVSSAVSNLQSAVAEYNKILDDFKTCATFYSSEFSTKMEPTYNIDITLDYKNGDYSASTKLNKSRTSYSTNNFEGSTTVDVPSYVYDYYSWPKTLTFTTTPLVINFDITKPQSSKTVYTYTYTLPNDSSMYRYVNKTSRSEKTATINSVYIGPHLPVAYDEKTKKLDITLTPTVTINGFAKEKPDFRSSLCKDPYKCSAGANKTGIIPVYRPIALSDPFPDQYDDGRQTGRNWCGSDGCSNTNTTVKRVITNNRNVKEDEVYTMTPLYTIELKPGDIKKIRDYNETTTYGDYNLVCKTDTGRNCLSMFLRGIVGGDGHTVLSYNISHLIKADKSCAINKNATGKCDSNDYYEEKRG